MLSENKVMIERLLVATAIKTSAFLLPLWVQ
jgi:hypothetical protein